MNKSQQIAEFIRINNPRRKDFIKHLLVNINGDLTEEQYDALKPNDSLHATWSTNITKWKRIGTVEVTKCRYKLTPLYRGSLYTTKLTPIKPMLSQDETLQDIATSLMQSKVNHWKALATNTHTHNEILKSQNQVLRDKLTEILNIVE